MRRITVVTVGLALLVSACAQVTSRDDATRETAPTVHNQAVTFDQHAVDLNLDNLCGPVDDTRTVTHPSLGRATVGLRRPASTVGNGCVAAVGPGGQKLLVQEVYVHDGELRFANPAQDATQNVFVIYNPGRYNGVMTLVPTATGYADIGWGAESPAYRTTTHAYYWVELLGPGGDGRYTIKMYDNNCEPDCAGGTVTTKILRWNGHRYV